MRSVSDFHDAQRAAPIQFDWLSTLTASMIGQAFSVLTAQYPRSDPAATMLHRS